MNNKAPNYNLRRFTVLIIAIMMIYFVLLPVFSTSMKYVGMFIIATGNILNSIV